MPATRFDHGNTGARILVLEAVVAELVKEVRAISSASGHPEPIAIDAVLAEVRKLGATLDALGTSQAEKIAAGNITAAAERLAAEFFDKL
jgi:hypothetical protein